MNRHERRKAEAQKRKASKEPRFPPGYIACVEKIARLIPEWLRAQPTTPVLRFVDWGDTCFAGPLRGEALRFLADSPDAFRLLEWLDEQTGGEATLLQAKVVLDRMRADPKEVKTSAAFQHLEAFAKAKFEPFDAKPCPCPWCGVRLDAASPASADAKLEPGCFSVCVRCGGINRYGEDLTLEKVEPEQLAELPADFRHQLEEMGDLMRAARMMATKKREPNVYRTQKVEA